MVPCHASLVFSHGPRVLSQYMSRERTMQCHVLCNTTIASRDTIFVMLFFHAYCVTEENNSFCTTIKDTPANSQDSQVDSLRVDPMDHYGGSAGNNRTSRQKVKPGRLTFRRWQNRHMKFLVLWRRNPALLLRLSSTPNPAYCAPSFFTLILILRY